jgi:hypothetical protein
MTLTNRIIFGITGAMISLLAIPAYATTVYNVSSTSVVNCSGSEHGLWTDSDITGGSCSNYFDIQDDSTFTIFNDDADSNNWYAELDMTALNPQGLEADIFLTLTGYSQALPVGGTYKQEGGALYNPATMDFFSSVLGIIGINGASYDIDGFVGDYAFQYGLGANAKSASEFGGSAWIQSCSDSHVIVSACMTSDHWDLNLTFSEVPEPASLVLMSIGLLGMYSRRRKFV